MQGNRLAEADDRQVVGSGILNSTTNDTQGQMENAGLVSCQWPTTRFSIFHVTHRIAALRADDFAQRPTLDR